MHRADWEHVYHYVKGGGGRPWGSRDFR